MTPGNTADHWYAAALQCCSTGQAPGPAGSGDRWWRPLQWPRAMQHWGWGGGGYPGAVHWLNTMSTLQPPTSRHLSIFWSGSEGSSYYNINIYILFTASISSDFSSMISYDTHFKLDLWNWGLSIFFPSPRWAACHMCAGAVVVDAESWLQPASD